MKTCSSCFPAWTRRCPGGSLTETLFPAFLAQIWSPYPRCIQSHTRIETDTTYRVSGSAVYGQEVEVGVEARKDCSLSASVDCCR